MILPVEDAAFIDQFCKTFDIQRGDDPGLTIVVPWCDPDITGENLVRAVLRDYFWPILRGELEVIVEAPEMQTVLDARSLRTEVEKIGGDIEKEVSPLYELAAWANKLGESDYVKVGAPEGWKWAEAMFPSESLALMRSRFENGHRVALRIAVKIAEKGQIEKDSFFNVFLCRDGAEERGRPVFIRDGIIIPDVRRYGSGILRGVRSLVVAEDPALATLLGDAENPAHTQWQKDGANFKGKYEDGPRILEFIMHSPIETVRILNEQDKKEDRTLLLDFFSISAPPDEEESRTREKKTRQDKGEAPEEPTPPDTRPRPFTIHQIEGGFVVRNGDADAVVRPKILAIRAAYHVRRGNPFKKYHPADFDFCEGMETHVEGAALLEKKQNELRVKIDHAEFRMEVTGFDPNRDVRVEVRQEEDDDAGSDA